MRLLDRARETKFFSKSSRSLFLLKFFFIAILSGRVFFSRTSPETELPRLGISGQLSLAPKFLSRLQHKRGLGQALSARGFHWTVGHQLIWRSQLCHLIRIISVQSALSASQIWLLPSFSVAIPALFRRTLSHVFYPALKHCIESSAWSFPLP